MKTFYLEAFMKKILMMFILLLAYAVLEAAQVNTPEASITVPDNWNVLEASEPMLALAEYRAGAASVDVVLAKERSAVKGPAAMHREAGMKNIQDIFQNIRVINAKDNYWIYEYSDDEQSSPIRRIQYFYSENDSVYTLTFSAPQKLFNSYMPIFEQIEKSLVFRRK
jgi:hypothetical protein